MAIGREDLLEDPKNLVELCVSCHEHTSASLIRAHIVEGRVKVAGGSNVDKTVGWKVKCFRCGRVTHLPSQCDEKFDVSGHPLLPGGSKNQWVIRRHGVSCFRCGFHGHRWKDCSAKRHIDGRPLFKNYSD